MPSRRPGGGTLSPLDLAPGASPTLSPMTNTHLLAGRFGALTQLSPKALRLYADQGLLVPDRIDPATGYRYYAISQAATARLIARLRRLGLPMARIARLLALDEMTRAAELRAWLAAQADRLAEQSELVDAIVRRPADGDAGLAGAARARRARCQAGVPANPCRYRRPGTLRQTRRRVAATPLARAGLAADGPLMLHFHEAVGHDGAGRIEAAIAYAGHLEPSGELSLRLRPAGREAHLPAPAALQTYPQVLRLYDAIERWLDGQAGSRCAGSPYEIHPHRRRPLRCRLPHRTLRLHAAPALHRLRPLLLCQQLRHDVRRTRPSTAVIEFATGSPFGMQMLGARCRCSIPMAGIRTLASTARWRRWAGARTAVAAAARARRWNVCTTRWRMVPPGSVRSRWDTSGISLA